MASFRFEGREVSAREGDSIASALYRSGVRTFNRSLKYHRRRGLYCMTGDCPNCLVNVDGEPGIRSCIRKASDGQVVRRETGWPGPDRDLLAVTDRLHRVMPVGFYYKTFVRPRFAWRIAEKVIRRATGVGALPLDREPSLGPVRHAAVELLVIGGGPAGIAAAVSAANAGSSVILCDEGKVGWTLTRGSQRDLAQRRAEELIANRNAEVLEDHTAIGVYEGPLVPLAGETETVHVHPSRVIVATGAVESHALFPGNDLPGVWLGRGAARMCSAHRTPIGSRAVVVARNAEGLQHAETISESGVEIAALVVGPVEEPRDGSDAALVGRVLRANGRRHVESVVVLTAQGSEREIVCDALVISDGWAPRDALLRMAADDEPVSGVGDVIAPGCSLEDAIRMGEAAGRGEEIRSLVGSDRVDPSMPGEGGFVCLCEDVGVGELGAAWAEGWRSSEILKRYTTATMGPCQGAMCGRHLAAFASARGASSQRGARTTARPPARPVRLEDLAAGVDEVIAKRTALHDIHRIAGAALGWSGSWIRPFNYGDVAAEYEAVRTAVSVMDVGTLGKFLIAGRDATELVDRVFPCSVRDMPSGRSRYLLALDEAGYVMDDGLVSALGGGRWYVTSTSGGADRMEAWLRDWGDRWGMNVHILNLTAMTAAINIAGPLTRDLLQRLSQDDLSSAAIPYPGHGEITVAGVLCRAIRVGFVGELSFELHHPRSQSPGLWDSLMSAGAEMGIRPHGLDALDLLRLEKAHIYLGQDTLPDDHPQKLGMGWAVARDKDFIGSTALRRMAGLPLERKLVGLGFDGAPQRGMPLTSAGRVVGRVTSCARSTALQRWIGLGWIRSVDGAFPERVDSGNVSVEVVPTPFYDPGGERMRA